jgi:hypothetical protein
MRLEMISLPCVFLFLLMNFIVNNIEHFHKLTQGTGIMFINQSPTFHVFKKVHTILTPKYSTVYHQILKVLRIK